MCAALRQAGDTNRRKGACNVGGRSGAAHLKPTGGRDMKPLLTRCLLPNKPTWSLIVCAIMGHLPILLPLSLVDGEGNKFTAAGACQRCGCIIWLAQ